MIGCLRRIGCLAVVFIALCVAAWFSRDWWLPKVGLRSARPVTTATWETPTAAGARRADDAFIQLESPRGPAFANVSAGDLLAYVTEAIGKAVPKAVDSIQASVVGERLYVRFLVDADAIETDTPSPIAFLTGRQRVTMGGTLRVIRPGFSELQVKDVAIGSLRLPQAMIPKVIKQFGGERPSGLSPDGVPVETPDYIGDVRIANGRITVYKTP